MFETLSNRCSCPSLPPSSLFSFLLFSSLFYSFSPLPPSLLLSSLPSFPFLKKFFILLIACLLPHPIPRFFIPNYARVCAPLHQCQTHPTLSRRTLTYYGQTTFGKWNSLSPQDHENIVVFSGACSYFCGSIPDVSPGHTTCLAHENIRPQNNVGILRDNLKFFPSTPNIRYPEAEETVLWDPFSPHGSHGEINIPLSHPYVKTIFRMESTPDIKQQ